MTTETCDWISFNRHRAELRKRGRLECRIVSGSMEPLVRVGETVTAEPFPGLAGLKRFDLIVFHYGTELRCHFVWSIDRSGPRPLVSTRSLREPLGPEMPIEEGMILGKVPGKKISGFRRAAIVLRNLIRSSG